MGDMLSQAEIDALLGGGDDSSDSNDESLQLGNDSIHLSDEQKDILGEIGNITMGTSATTLFALLNQKVWITTPSVSIMNWTELSKSYNRPCVGIRVDYKEGIRGSNVLILKQRDVKIISNLMMGGDGSVEDDFELNDIDLSAIAEAMNQMVGSSSTSLASLVKMKIDIDTPHAFLMDFNDDQFFEDVGFHDEDVVSIAFKMEIGSLIDSEIMQILPIEFAIQMVDKLKDELYAHVAEVPKPKSTPPPTISQQPPVQQQPIQPQQFQQPIMPEQPMMYQQPQMNMDYVQQPQPQMNMGYVQQPQPQMNTSYAQPQQMQQNINVQPVQFQSFDVSSVMQQKENIGIIMDVPLEVTVELGRATKKIKEILEFNPGTVVELDKLAGEPINILVNGKFIARGEVVVIDENFGVRITDIVNPENRV